MSEDRGRQVLALLMKSASDGGVVHRMAMSQPTFEHDRRLERIEAGVLLQMRGDLYLDYEYAEEEK